MTFLDEKNAKLVDIYRDKCKEYMERAEYIKKTVIKKEQEPTNAGGGAASAQAKK